MAAIDRVMLAYARKYKLSPAQTAMIRKELAEFIEQLTARPWREPPVVASADSGGSGAAGGEAP